MAVFLFFLFWILNFPVPVLLQDFLEEAGAGHRCDLQANLLRRGCGPEFTEKSDIKVDVNATVGSTQVSPRDIAVTLTPGRLRRALACR